TRCLSDWSSDVCSSDLTSDALGAAAVQIGPRAPGLAAVMTKQMGLSLDNARQMLALGCGLRVNRSTLCRALLRMSGKAEPTYEEIGRASCRERAQGSGG